MMCLHAGNTPLMRIRSLSEALGVDILVRPLSLAVVDPSFPEEADPVVGQGKCEYLNPFGSVKDRVSLKSENLSPPQP